MRLYAGHIRFTHFCAVLSCILQPIEADSDIISGVAIQYVGNDAFVNLVFLGQTVLEIYDCLIL